MSRAVSRSIQIGLFLILLGTCFIYENIVGHASIWLVFWRYSPLLFIWVGINKAVAYFRFQPDGTEEKPPSFSTTLLWIGCGVFLLLWTTGTVSHFFAYLGNWWPAFLVLVGAGKIVDIFFPGRTGRLTGGEIVFMIFLLLIGLTARQIATFDLSRVPPLLIEGKEYRLKDLLHKSHLQTIEDTIPLEGALALALSHSNGDLDVVPGEGPEVKVRLEAKVYADSEENARMVAQTIRLKTEREAGRLRLVLQAPDTENASTAVRIHLAVPADIPLEFDNNYGGIAATDLRNPIVLTTRNGPITVRGHRGAIRLNNRYDKVVIEDSEGETAIQGLDTDVRVINLTGALTVENKNGQIELEDISGKTVFTGRYMSISGERLTGDFHLTGKNTDVTLSTVQGNVTVDDADDSIRLTEVQGNLTFNLRACKLSATDVRGGILGKAGSGSVHLVDAGGAADLSLEKTRCTIEGIKGQLKVTNSLKDISIDGAEAGIDCSNQNASITLRSLPPAGKFRVQAATERGDILLLLPVFPETHRLFLSAENGTITSVFSAPVVTPSPGEKILVWKNFSGSPEQADVRCKAVYGNIRLKSSQGAEEEQ
jgi:DUF4097 and DUF4098 domain-containing protein YvlB